MPYVAGGLRVSISGREAFARIPEIFLSGIGISGVVHVRAECLDEPPALELDAVYPTSPANGANPSMQDYQQSNSQSR